MQAGTSTWALRSLDFIHMGHWEMNLQAHLQPVAGTGSGPGISGISNLLPRDGLPSFFAAGSGSLTGVS